MDKLNNVNNGGLKSVSKEQKEYDSAFKDDELSAKRENTKNRKTLFYSVLGTSFIIMIVAVGSSVCTLLRHDATTQNVAILALIITAPIIMILALMRYVYDGKKTDDPQPTLMLNIGKEFAAVLTTIFKK